MILVTGATGHFGKAAIAALLKKGVPADAIAAMVRNPEKATELASLGVQLRVADYSDSQSLEKAFTGIDQLLLVSGNDLENREAQQLNAVKAAKEAGVKHLVYTSFARKNESETSPIAFVAQSHLATEKAIRASGIPYTLMLNSLYADVLPLFFGEQVLENGIFLPAGNGKTSFALRAEMAEAAAEILTGSGHENREYVIANTENISLDEAATVLSDIAGKKINYASPTVEAYTETLTKAGVPPPYIGMFAGFSQAIAQGEFETSQTDLEQLIGRKPASLQSYLETVYGK